ncbi:glutathione S-transferase [Sedimentitalea sp. JM2-8]|uniref:Glutathione S-transferase n=1 Tax=Sedimentitalea xiamensis TaxID=3050037 RepID=A0ABT7FIR7_9RHOB|nr:glutathione S-transferase [Sedimentitalea xiamensis]MDK3075031.1 glutathione S-transferase [Sedimentitalea xiamensis]
MKLFFSPASPFVRKVNVLLHELGRTDEVALEPVATTAFQPSETLVASNPLGKIPALVRDDGTTLYDSRVICAYLNELFQGSLYPQGSRRWEVLTLEATGDGIMDCGVSMTYETRLRPPEQQSPEWIEAQWAKIARAISVLNARWISHLTGPLDMGQISVACALAYIDFRHGLRNWRQGNDTLAAWFSEFESRPSMMATLPPAG